METWPNFFNVGAPKAGSTSIYEYLKNHPQIFMSPIKEPNYFSTNILTQYDQLRPIRNKKKYLDPTYPQNQLFKLSRPIIERVAISNTIF